MFRCRMVLVAAAGCLLLGCSSSDGSSGGSVDGGGLDGSSGSGGGGTIAPGVTYLKNGNEREMVNPSAFYEASDDETVIKARDSKTSYPHRRSLRIVVPGMTTGEFSCNGNVAPEISDTEDSVSCTPTICPSATNWSTNNQNASCTINISSYGDVGQPIVGTFSGTLITDGTKELMVEGAFNIPRGDDQ